MEALAAGGAAPTGRCARGGRQGHPAAAPDRGDHSAPETGIRLGDPRATRGIPRVSSFWL